MPIFTRRVRALAVTLAALGGLAVPAPAQATTTGAFVALSDVAPSILQDIRYDTRHNFVGRRIDGYRRPLCILTRQAADGLRKVQAQLVRQGYTLKVYDCYRPQRAVDHFVRWAKDLADEKMKAEFYPNVAKDRLFADGYIAEKSGHSRGSTMDLTLVRLPPAFQRPYHPGEPLKACFAPRGQRFPDNTVDMGTGYDCFDVKSYTRAVVNSGERKNRNRLLKAMSRHGFRNYKREWWHFSYPAADQRRTYDVPVR